MGVVPEFKKIRRSYGFDEVAIVPGNFTIDPDQTSTEFSMDGITLNIPVLASAMDAIVSPSFAVAMGKQGGLAVLNLEGLQTRYENPSEILNSIVESPVDKVTEELRRAYSEPIKEDLIGLRISEIKAFGTKCAVSVTPGNTNRLAPIAAEAGTDILVVQSTVTTARHVSKGSQSLVFSELLKTIHVPVVVGNCVTYDVALELMETGIQGVIIGVGPGAACTTREVTAVGVPQVSATMDCAAAREQYYSQSGRYVPIITDGGIRTAGDLCKAFACGADAVMIGTPLAQSKEAPGRGNNWGMASPHPDLPRGTRVKTGVSGTLEQILFGPSAKTDGTHNLIGALKVCMGMVGAFNIKDMHKTAVSLAPSIKTEGKYHQLGLS